MPRDDASPPHSVAGVGVRMIAIAIVGSLLAACLLALVDLRVGSGIGCALSVALVTTLHKSKLSRARAIASGAIAGVLAAYLVHLTQQIVGPAWPNALAYTKSIMIAPAITVVFAALALYDARASENVTIKSAPPAGPAHE